MSPVKKVPIIVNAVACYYQIDPKTLQSSARTNARTLEARSMAMAIVRQHTGYTYVKISELFGYRTNDVPVRKSMQRFYADAEYNRIFNFIEQLILKQYV